jgi:hypothetical protein
LKARNISSCCKKSVEKLLGLADFQKQNPLPEDSGRHLEDESFTFLRIVRKNNLAAQGHICEDLSSQ